MALIYRRSPRRIARKIAASQMQAGCCNNCLIRSESFSIFVGVQKSLVSRVQFWVTSKVANSARQGQPGAAQVQVSGRVKARVRVGPGRRAMAGPRALGAGRARVRCRGPVQGQGPGIGPGAGWAGPGPAVGQGQVQGSRPSASLLGPSLGACPRGLALAVPPCCGPVPWGPGHGEGQTLRWIDLSRCRLAQ
jgi:hypothetical protein